MSSLTSLGLSAEQAVELVSHNAIGAAQRGSEAVEGIFDASDRAEGGGVIVWFNDIENDSGYAGWSPSLHTVCADCPSAVIS
jgi:UDP-glucose:glycoprotein glucosyltransferase